MVKRNENCDDIFQVINNKFKSGITISIDIFDTDQVAYFADSLNFYMFYVNVINSVISFLIIGLWSFTITGERMMWMKLRLASCASLLASTFVVLATMIFSTYFDHLVMLKEDKGYFITDNESMYEIGSHVLRVSLNGLSLTVTSFTIVFLFHGVGGGLFCGTVIFR